MAVINDVARLDREGDIAVLVVDHPPVNALSKILREGLKTGIEQAAADETVSAIVLLCEGATFMAGADIKEFGRPMEGPSLADLNAMIEAAPKPVVAAMHGTALGGGFELAMACHYRIAVPSAKVGLPEIKLGLIPGAGGTQRLPRLVGVRRALAAILSGEPFGAATAKELGAIDAIAEGDLRSEAIRFARAIVADGARLRRVRDLDGKLRVAGGVTAVFDEAKALHGRRLKGFDSFKGALKAVHAATALSFEDGLALEREIFAGLLGGEQSKAQRYLFGATRAAAKIPDIGPDTKTRPVATVGIVGAGTMGSGIAMSFLSAGIPVILVETGRQALDRGVATIARTYETSAAKGRIRPEDVGQRMGRLKGSLALGDLGGCDLVVEAVFEDLAVKKDVFRQLDRIVKPGAILASNTSYLDIDAIAAATRRPEHVLGLHFFSPANIMTLVEVVRGAATSKEVVATAMALGRTLGKTAVLVGVCHGFVGNRMLAVRQREANALILEGAMPWDVDRVVAAFGMPMGPFRMADLAGLDLGWTREASRGETIRDRLCEADRRGQKTGAGFYDYDEARHATPSPLTEGLVLELAEAKGIRPRPVSDAEILERLIYPMINEGAKILGDGIALRASDIDVVWVNGYGWPATKGGPMFWADAVGPALVLDKMRALEAEHGADLAPAEHLVRMVAEGRAFTAAARSSGRSSSQIV